MKKNMRFVQFCLLVLGVFWITLPASGVELTNIDEFLYPEAQRTISMDFKNAPLGDVLKIFSQQSGLNFIAATSVADKSINLYLEEVPVEEALERILSANSLTYEIKPGSNIFVVKPLERLQREYLTRVYPLKYATVSSSKLNTTLSTSGEDSSVSTGASASASALGAGGTGTASGGTGIASAMRVLLSEFGSVIEDPRTNSLIVTDIPIVFPAIEQTIARLDVKIPQILIEVEMLDISKISADLLGAKWGDTPVTFHGAERDTLFPFNTDNLVDHGGITFEEAQYRVATLSFAGLKYSLQFLKTQSDTRNLARPRILTLNNETAEIEISTNEAIGLASTTTSAEGTASSVEEAERVQTGVFLKVTPQANMDTHEITLAIEPKVIVAQDGEIFGGTQFKDPEERGTRSILRVKDGDTIILGGLLRTDLSDTRTKVPVFGDIPFLGAAFRHKDKSNTERELVVFITPHILSEDLAANNRISDAKQLIREQNVPSKRLKTIDDELTSFEKQIF